MENLVAVDWVVDVADEEGVGVGVEGGVEVASGVFFGEAEDELVDHVERDVLRGGGGVFELDLEVLLHAVESDEEADSDTEDQPAEWRAVAGRKRRLLMRSISEAGSRTMSLDQAVSLNC